ncbi:hypothetical protein [Frankia sp. Cas3]|uniref:hypothetical protein n=1 Tax=Frankia sp. Cas3 TaxID=3073926 RepID=UPI002AD43A80|nr:hypothetical protein [Frankia sp. Cas3]
MGSVGIVVRVHDRRVQVAVPGAATLSSQLADRVHPVEAQDDASVLVRIRATNRR